MKTCSRCKVDLPLESFYKRKASGDGLGSKCKECTKEYNKEEAQVRKRKERRKLNPPPNYSQTPEAIALYNVTRRVNHRKDPRKAMFNQAKLRAKRQEVPFDIVIEDIIIPEYCPVFPWVRLEVDNERNTSPSLDKLIPKLGYVKGNINVISHKANRYKSDSTRQEIELLLQWMLKQEA